MVSFCCDFLEITFVIRILFFIYFVFLIGSIFKTASSLENGLKNLSKTFRRPKWSNFLGLVYKDTLLIRRSLGFLAMQFILPVLQVSLFCLCIGREPYNLKFGIVNNETIYNSSDKTASLMYINTLDNRTFVKVILI
jgi:hypothetical protein